MIPLVAPSRRSLRSPARLAAGLSILAALAAWSGGARAQTKTECVAAYKEGQIQRKDGELLSARRSFEVCSSAACSPVLRRDCEPWLAQVKEAIPTLAVRATAADGQPLSSPRVLLDGAAAAIVAGSGALELDPGAHVIRVEADGFEPIEQSVKVRAGERSVPVDLVLSPIRRPGSGDEPPPSRPVPASAIVFGALGLAGIGAFVGFGLWGNEQRARLEACKPACEPSRVDEVKRDYVIADASLGLGVASLGLATLFFFTRPEVPRAGVSSVTVQIAPGRAGLGLSGSF